MKYGYLSIAFFLIAIAVFGILMQQMAFASSRNIPSNSATSQNDTLTVNILIRPGNVPVGHVETITANAAGGTPSGYTLNIINASGLQIYSNSINTTSSSATFSWNAVIAGQFYANVSVQSNSVANQIISQNIPFTVEPGLALNSTSLKSNAITAGHVQEITVNISGGAAPYVYNYTVYNDTNAIVANAVHLSNLTSNTLMFNQSANFGVGNFITMVSVTDSSDVEVTKGIDYIVEPEKIINAIVNTSNTTILNTSSIVSGIQNYQTLINKLKKQLDNASQSRPKKAIAGIYSIAETTYANHTNISDINLIHLPKDIGIFNGANRVFAENEILVYSEAMQGIATVKTADTNLYSATMGNTIVSYSSLMPQYARAPLLVSPNTMLSSIVVESAKNESALTTNVSLILNPKHVQNFKKQAYLEFIVNSTLSDAEVIGAEYNFSVSRAWINNTGLLPQQVTLYKYIVANGTWMPMQTSLTGSNSTEYHFSALSDSLSTYLVSYTQSGAHSNSGSALTVSIPLPSGYKLYLCSAGASVAINGTPVPSWTSDVNAPPGIALSTDLVNASIGHQTSDTCTATMVNSAYYGMTIAGIGVNATKYNLYTASAEDTGLVSLPYSVTTSNSFTVIMEGGGYTGGELVNVPSGCTSNIYYGNYSNAFVGVCQNQLVGNYIVKASDSNSTDTSMALAAYIFPPGNVILDDNPSTATITTNGNTYTDGQAMQVIGTNVITANPPATGSWTFDSWSVSNSINLTVANALNPSTTLTVIGNGIVTATWENETTTFHETGLPTPFTWNAIYDGALTSSSTNTISFVDAPGTYQFTISNQIINGNSYVPFPSSGSASTGKTSDINFTLEGKPALRVSNNPDIYGNTDLVTVNAIPSSDYVDLNVSGGIFGSSNVVAGPTESSLSYTFPVVSPNAYTLNALDTNTLKSTTVNLTVSKASSTISLPNFPSSFFYNGNTATITANILTYDSQLPLNIYVNNAIVAATNTQTSVQVGPFIGNYVVTAETQGNGNYTDASITKSFSIETPPPKSIANYAANAGASATSPLTVSTASAYNLYLCTGGAGNGAVTYTTGTVDQYSAGDYAYIGHQTANGCTETTANPDLAEAIFGINDTAYTLQMSTGKSSVSLTFNVVEPGSLAAIMISAGDYGFSGPPVIPSGCNELESVTGGDTYESAYVAVCPSLAAGAYTASVALSNTAGKAEIGAYIFPPNYVNLNDVPSTASMTVNGTVYPNHGKVILLGQTSANAIAPTSSFAFEGWKASNSNITITNALSQNTLISATGNGTLTAAWNGIGKFIESGLPGATTWNAIYDGVLNTSDTNTISFSTMPGNFAFTVANQVLNGITYVPSPATGYLGAGNTTAITFTPVVCTISLASNSINFGSMYAGSNIATIDGVTDNNIGNTNAYMLVYGGNWIGPASLGVSNTTWAASNDVAFPASRLSALAYNTTILVPASSSNDIHLGLGIPGGAPAGDYTQDITIENSC